MHWSLWAIAALLTGLAALTLHKVRRIHLATYALSLDVSAIRRETAVLFQQIQALSALERKLHLEKPLPPLRNWAGSPDFLMVVATEIESSKPTTVMECSSGASTLVCARMLQLNGAGHVYSLEHEEGYANATEQLLSTHGLSEWATILRAPLDTVATRTPWYSLAEMPHNLPAVDLLIVDGPPSTVGAMARYPTLPRLAARLASRVTVIVDDALREDEIEMIKKWQREYPEFNKASVDCEKGCVVLKRGGNDLGLQQHISA